MSTVTTSCDSHGPVELDSADVELILYSSTAVDEYRFTCPSGGEEVYKPADQRAVDILVSGSVPWRDAKPADLLRRLQGSLSDPNGGRLTPDAEQRIPRRWEESKRSIAELDAELQSLAGLDGARRRVRDFVSTERANARRRELGMAAAPANRHLVFYGERGTGKSTVARLVAGYRFATGTADTDKFVEADASTLVGADVRETERKVLDLWTDAEGGVVFVGNADELVADGKVDNKDLRAVVVRTLNELAGSDRIGTALIVAGSPGFLRKFDEVSPQWSKRVQNAIVFETPSREDLVEIYRIKAAQLHLTVDEHDDAAILETIEAQGGAPLEGNANAIVALVDRARQRLDDRVSELPRSAQTAGVMSVLTAADIHEAGPGPRHAPGRAASSVGLSNAGQMVTLS